MSRERQVVLAFGILFCAICMGIGYEIGRDQSFDDCTNILKDTVTLRAVEALPKTCFAGEVVFNIPESQLYQCIKPETWSPLK